MPGGLTKFAYPYFNSHPYTGDKMFEAVVKMFAKYANVPDIENIGSRLTDEQMDIYAGERKASKRQNQTTSSPKRACN